MTCVLTTVSQTAALAGLSVVVLVLIIFIAFLLFVLSTVMKDRDRWRDAWKGVEGDEMTAFMQRDAKKGELSEETATEIVKLLVANGMKPNDIVNSALVRKWAKDASLADVVYQGLSSALAKGWIDIGFHGVTTKLTQAGFVAGS